jgi:hypothetical protein
MISPGGIIASNYEWNLNPTSGHHPGCLAQLNTESVFETLVLISISIAIVLVLILLSSQCREQVLTHYQENC